MIPSAVTKRTMTYCKQGLGAIPADTAKCFRKPSKSQMKFVQIEEIIMEAFADVDLSAFFGKRGQWGIHPLRVCALLLLQAMEGLTDRQVEEAVSLNIGWKYVLHLGLRDEGWDASVLCEHRNRFTEETGLAVFFDSILLKAKEKGLLDTRMQRMDSTFVVANVRNLQRVELILEAVRNVLEETTEVALDWIDRIKLEHWIKTYYLDRPFNFKIPKEESKRTAIAEASAEDGYYILDCVDSADPATKQLLLELESMELLRKILDDHFKKTNGKNGKGKVKMKAQKELAPSGERIASIYDTDARAASKGGKSIVGYRTHTAETCTPGYPNLVTHVQTEIATLNDSLSFNSIIKSLSKRKLAPKKLFVDGGYVNAGNFANWKKSLGIDFVARLANGNSWQLKQGKGFDIQNFPLDWRNQQATCPAQKKSKQWKSDGTGGFNIYFSAEDCGSCPFKENCAQGKYRILHVKAKPIHRYMTKMRIRQNTEEFRQEYKVRAGVEGLQSQLIRIHGRRTRVKTKTKVGLKMVLAATALNVSRILDWFNKKPRSKTRQGKYQSAFAVA